MRLDSRAVEVVVPPHANKTPVRPYHGLFVGADTCHRGSSFNER